VVLDSGILLVLMIKLKRFLRNEKLVGVEYE
jgi:hypothetical protein